VKSHVGPLLFVLNEIVSDTRTEGKAMEIKHRKEKQKQKRSAWKKRKNDCCDTKKGQLPPSLRGPVIELGADGKYLKISVHASHACGIAELDLKVTILEPGATSPWETSATSVWQSCPDSVDDSWEWGGTTTSRLPVNLTNCLVTAECTVIDCCNRWVKQTSEARLKK
jgi:hypothetical protein